MGYAIDADRIVLKHRVELACTFNPDEFGITAINIGAILNQRKLIARRIVARGLSEGDGEEYENLIASFIECDQKIKQYLGLCLQ